MKSLRKKLIPISIFLFGLLIFTYPSISNKFYEIKANREIDKYNLALEKINEGEIKNKFNLARVYNDTLDPKRIKDPFTSEEKEARKMYAHMLEVEEKLGYVEIPKIKVKLPIYAGSSEEILRKGAGHLEGTSLPIGGKSTHSVITAHRGLSNAKFFTDLDKLELGDHFHINILGEVLVYKVDQILTVEPSNFEPILVVEDKDYQTLLTCTPYSINSHRLLVRGERVFYGEGIYGDELKMDKVNGNYKYYLFISLVVIFLLSMYIYGKLRELRKLEGSKNG